MEPTEEQIVRIEMLQEMKDKIMQKYKQHRQEVENKGSLHDIIACSGYQDCMIDVLKILDDSLKG